MIPIIDKNCRMTGKVFDSAYEDLDTLEKSFIEKLNNELMKIENYILYEAEGQIRELEMKLLANEIKDYELTTETKFFFRKDDKYCNEKDILIVLEDKFKKSVQNKYSTRHIIGFGDCSYSLFTLTHKISYTDILRIGSIRTNIKPLIKNYVIL